MGVGGFALIDFQNLLWVQIRNGQLASTSPVAPPGKCHTFPSSICSLGRKVLSSPIRTTFCTYQPPAEPQFLGQGSPCTPLFLRYRLAPAPGREDW
jgi:hypothetical protein